MSLKHTVDTNDILGCALLGEVADATRCLMTYREPAARARPGAAWLMLPIGMPIGLAVANLMEMPEAPDDASYAHNLEILQLRYGAALAAWKNYQLDCGAGRVAN